MLRLDTFGGVLAIFVLFMAATFGGVYVLFFLLPILIETITGILWWVFG